MANWILIFVLHISGTEYAPFLREPILIDSYATKEQCEATLRYLTKTSLGTGNCWGEAR